MVMANVTKGEDHIHAYSTEHALKYLKALQEEMVRLGLFQLSANSHSGTGVRWRSRNSDDAYTHHATLRSKSRKNSGSVTSASLSTK
jgi:hypothetical protein